MAFQVSPGVNVREIDLTTVVPAVSTTVGAIAGVFSWGPAEQRVLVGSETSLTKIFGKPTADNFETFYTAANFLAYGNALYVVRAVSNTANNAQALQPSSTATTIQINNLEEYGTASLNSNVYFYARCPGTLGNSLKVSVCDSAAAFSSNVDLDFTTGDAITYSTTIDSATAFNTSKATSTSKSTATTTALNTTTTFDTTTAFNTTGARCNWSETT